jgi:hypothetical protein
MALLFDTNEVDMPKVKRTIFHEVLLISSQSSTLDKFVQLGFSGVRLSFEALSQWNALGYT